MRSDFIRRIPIFASLSDDEFKSLQPAFLEKRYKKNQVIFLEEETGNYMYIVLSGRVKVSKATRSGKESILTIHKPGDFFGEMSLLDGQTRLATVSAQEDCRIVSIFKADFFRYLMRNEKVVQQIIGVLCARLRQAWTQIQDLSYSSADARIRSGIQQLSRRYGLPDARGILIDLKITHQELAEMFGTSRETVTRTLARLQKKGILSLDHHRIILKDPKALALASD